MITYAKAILALLNLARSLTQYVSERQLLNAGEQKAIANALKSQAQDLEKAIAAREKQRASNNAVSGVLPDDGFRRD